MEKLCANNTCDCPTVSAPTRTPLNPNQDPTNRGPEGETPQSIAAAKESGTLAVQGMVEVSTEQPASQ